MNERRQLNICFLSHGGMQHTIPYCRFFTSRGHNISCITYTPPKIDFGDMEVYDISTGFIPRNVADKLIYLVRINKLRKVLRGIKPDILHGHYVTSAGLLCLFSGFRPYVLTAHGSDVIDSMKSYLWKNLLRIILRQASLVNTVSDELTILATKLGVPHEKILILSLGVDTNLFCYRPSRVLQPPVKLLCTRRLAKVFDPLTIVNACKILKTKSISFRLTFAAGGPLERQLQNLVSENKLGAQVTFMGGYDNSDLPELLQNHDIYISASLWDGTSISLLEAMSAGIFPVVSRITSNMAWLQENSTTFMFEAGNAAELAEKIIQTIKDDKLRQTATEKNRKLVVEKANREKNMLLLERKYYEIVK